MPNNADIKRPVEDLINKAESIVLQDSAGLEQELSDEISLRPEWGIELIECLKYEQDEKNEKRLNVIYRLIEESFSQILYSIDRKDTKGQFLLHHVQEKINEMMPSLSFDVRFRLNYIIFNSKLPLEIDQSNEQYLGDADNINLDIMPRLPELLDQLRRENKFKTSFELCELILPHIMSMPTDEQLSLIIEMAQSKKPIVHEVSVLMLLHPKAMIRKIIANVLYRSVSTEIFTPIDLRRIILIRNWVPTDERKGIDTIISHLRRKNLSPAPYMRSKIAKIVASSMDGAGAAFIMFETKTTQQRKVAAFVIKVDVGIRDPWVMSKAPKNYFDNLVQDKSDNEIPLKRVSKAYVDRMVQHFLEETIKNEGIPEASFIEVAELFGANNWQPQSLSWLVEINRLRNAYKDQLSDSKIKDSLHRSGHWHLDQSISKSWFETGDVAMKSLNESTSEHNQNSTHSLETIATRCLMSKCLDKWKDIFLITCLWMRSKKEHELCADLFTILHCLDENMDLSEIPLLCNVTAQTMATVLRREISGVSE